LLDFAGQKVKFTSFQLQKADKYGCAFWERKLG